MTYAPAAAWDYVPRGRLGRSRARRYPWCVLWIEWRANAYKRRIAELWEY